MAAIGAVTTAVRLKRLAVGAGINNVRVIHTPASINKGGCSYSLQFPKNMAGNIKKIARTNNIVIKGIFVERRKGKERVYDALS